jgi:hypothetical protein
MKAIFTSFIMIMSIFLVSIQEMNAQSTGKTTVRRTTTNGKSKSKKDKKETFDWRKKLNPELHIGNLGFFNGFIFSMKTNVGYKFTDRLSAGIGGKINYWQLRQSGPDFKIFDYGGLGYGRFRITDAIAIQAEYNLTRFSDNYQFTNAGPPGGTVAYPAFGLAYYSGYGDLRYGASLLYLANSEAQDYINVVEYWVGLSYNF